MKSFFGILFSVLLFVPPSFAQEKDDSILHQIEIQIIRTQISIHIDKFGGLNIPFVCLKIRGNDPKDETLSDIGETLIPVKKSSECMSPRVEIWIGEIEKRDNEVRAIAGLDIEDKRISVELYKIIKKTKTTWEFNVRQLPIVENPKFPNQSA